MTRLIQRRRGAGTLASKAHGGGRRPALGFPERARLARLITEHPDATLKQLKARGEFACTLTTRWRTSRRFDLTYKPKTPVRQRARPSLGAGQATAISEEVAADRGESAGFPRRDGDQHGHDADSRLGFRDKRAPGSVTSSWGSTTVSLDEVKAPLVFPGATDTTAFQNYVDQMLTPGLNPGDVAVFNNLKSHLASSVTESINKAGATVLRLPPYSSGHNPIERLLSQSKVSLVRSRRGRRRACTTPLVKPWIM